MITDNTILSCVNRFTESVHNILGEKLQSVYLYGSVTLQDYKDGWSDIDLICFASEMLEPTEADKLLMLRQSLVDSEKNPLFRKIEGAVVSLDELLKNQYSCVVYWGTSGQRITDSYTFDIFSLFEMKKYGELVFGEDIRDRFPLPSYSELAEGVKEHYDTIRKYARETDERLYSCGWLLDIARCIYTLRYGDIVGKTYAGEWVLRENICPCTDEMKKTLEVRNNPSDYVDREETKEWLCSLGSCVQLFADVLETELNKTLKNCINTWK